jgi:L-amino acid N-acyltransferase
LGDEPPFAVMAVAPAGRENSSGRPVSVRSAREVDNPSLAAIYNDAVRTTIATFDTEARSPEAQRAWLAHHDARHPVFVAESGGEVVGWASLSRWSDRKAYDATAEFSFYVRAGERGRGVGRLLLGTAVTRAAESGLHVLLARIAEPNPVSVHLHESFGFRRVGVMKEVGRKFDRWIDVHLFERMLAQNGPGGRGPARGLLTEHLERDAPVSAQDPHRDPEKAERLEKASALDRADVHRVPSEL